MKEAVGVVLGFGYAIDTQSLTLVFLCEKLKFKPERVSHF